MRERGERREERRERENPYNRSTRNRILLSRTYFSVIIVLLNYKTRQSIIFNTHKKSVSLHA